MLFKNEIKAIGFDVGHTLIKYKNPLNWQGLYRSGLEHTAAAADITLSEDMLIAATDVLLKYNTRVNYREWETTSDCIFNEIIKSWGIQTDLYALMSGFYSFFSRCRAISRNNRHNGKTKAAWDKIISILRLLLLMLVIENRTLQDM